MISQIINFMWTNANPTDDRAMIMFELLEIDDNEMDMVE